MNNHLVSRSWKIRLRKTTATHINARWDFGVDPETEKELQQNKEI